MTRSDKHACAASFTLTELLVVLGIIVLVMGIVLPSIIPLLASGTASQVRAVVSALLGAARGMAIERQSYALVHFQMGVDDKCWAAVLIYEVVKDPATGEVTGHRFIPAEGYRPRKMPGGLALAEVSSFWVTPEGHFQRLFDLPPPGSGIPNPLFTTFNVVFGPDGSLAELVPGTDGDLVVPNIHTDLPSLLFGAGTADQKIWEPLDPAILNEQGGRMMVAFNYKDLRSLKSGQYFDNSTREYYLENNGQLFVINPYTGQLLPSE